MRPDGRIGGAKPSRGVIIAWSLVAGWMGMIHYASSLPGKAIPSLFSFQDIAFHGFVYACLGFLCARAVRASDPSLARYAVVIIACLIGMVYGAGDEWYQQFVPGRSVSAKDWLVDSVGAFIGARIYR